MVDLGLKVTRGDATMLYATSHGRSDGTGMYALIATLLYYYFDERNIPGIKTLDVPVSEGETRDPVDDLPLLDLSKIK